MTDFDIQDEQDKRIADILLGEDKIPKISDKTLKMYLAYLKANLKSPCHFTGIEDFQWEERYVFGYGSKEEYEKFKKTRPSYTDTFKLMDFNEELCCRDYGLFVDVKRISDNKKFTLPLADLKASDQHSDNYQLFDDYAVWFVNYR
jgi:hypothetical protein